MSTTKINFEIADKEIREIVSEFKKNGFPEQVLFKEASKDFTKNQREAVLDLMKTAEKENDVEGNPENTSPGDVFWKARNRVREKIQKAIKLGLIHISIIQRQAVSYGAIPDSKMDWKYYLLPNLNYACWHCGEKILVKTQRVSVHDEDFGLAGSGKIRLRNVPYCPNCEKEPPDRDIVREDSAEDIANEWNQFAGKKTKSDTPSD